MSKERLIRCSLVSCVVVGIALLFGACLNPVSFNPDELPAIKVQVEGSITIDPGDDPAMVKLDDVAVMWLINRTKTVNVTNFTITRPRTTAEKDLTDEEFAYPKTFSQPGKGSSLATYHVPMETPYTISVSWEKEDGSETGNWTKDVQFPRPQDYRFYLYRTAANGVIVVDENEMKEMPDPNDTTTDPADPSVIDAQTFAVINVTSDQLVSRVDFVKDLNTYVLFGEPRAKDQKMILLGAGSFRTTVYYTRDGVNHQTTEKNVIVTRESGSMAVRTNFVYFYKTKNDDYQLSQTWPPIPDDSADDNAPEDILTDNQGILEIVNKATPSLAHDVLARVKINGTEYPSAANTSAYMVPGDTRRYIVSVGTVDVAFMPTDQTFYGMNIPREITPKATTRLEYSNNLANPETVPPDEGYGAGLIRITNNSTGVVVAVDIWDKADLNTSLSMGYENFTPPIPIQYGRVGRVPVVGTPAFPLNPGPNHIIQVTVETPAGLSVVERLAALRGAIVDIVITEDMFQDTSRTGSKVTVYNTTTHPTTIIGMEVYSKDPAITGTAVYNLGIPSPAGSQSLYVLSGSTLPILEGQHYKAQLTVFGNGNIAQIDKEFSPGDDLYSLTPDDHPRTITLVEADLPPELKETIVPLQSVTVVPNPYTLWSTTQSALDLSGMTLKTGGTLDLNTDMVVVYNPNDASKKQPIVWSVQSGGSYVNLNAGILTVTGIAPVGSRAITVRAAIADAGVNQASVYGDFTVNLMYNNEISTKKVTGIILTPATVQAGDTISLPGLAVLNPAGANINGVQITVDSLIWTVVSGGTGAGSISGSTFTAGTNGKVNVRATLPAAANDGTLVTADMIITVTAVPPPFVPITAVTWVNGSLRLPFATVTAPNGTTRTLSASPTPTLTLSKDSLSFNPATASKQEPITWELVSGGTASTGGFTLSGTNLSIKNQNPLPADIADGKTVNIKLSIPGSLNSNGTYTVTLPVTLVEYNSRPVAASGELSVANASIALNATIDLNTLVTLPAAYINTNGVTVPITAADLIWSLPSGPGTGNGTLSGSNFTGTLSGAVGVLATLPAAKNNGVEVVAAGIITVETPPPPPPAHPASLTFRIFKTNNSDYVREIALLPVSVSDDAGYPASLISLIRQTGHSNYAWANRTPDPTYRSNFVNWLSPYGLQLKGIVKLDSTGDYADVTIPWPTGSTVGYNLFFIEGDSRVRGYVRPAKLDPPKSSNYVFYLNFDTVKNYIIPMKGAYEAAPGTAGAVNVVGIAYNSHDNNAAILKSAGVGKIPNYDLRYPF